MDFRILGPLEVWTADTRIPLGAARDRQVLAVLLLEGGRVVPVDRLVDAIWENTPPESATKQVRNAVSRLRALIGATRIISDAAGYRIVVTDGEFDARLFESSVAHASRSAADGDLTRAAEILAEALALWRGPALAGPGGRVIEAAATFWNERRASAAETFFEYELTLERHAEALSGLMELVAEHPFREKPAGQLMLALHRCGRQGEALALFAEFRTRLAEDLGLDPSAELRELLPERRLPSRYARSAGCPAALQWPRRPAGPSQRFVAAGAGATADRRLSRCDLRSAICRMRCG